MALKAIGVMALVGLLGLVLIVPFGAGGDRFVAGCPAGDGGGLTIPLRTRRPRSDRSPSPRSSIRWPLPAAFRVGRRWWL